MQIATDKTQLRDASDKVNDNNNHNNHHHNNNNKPNNAHNLNICLQLKAKAAGHIFIMCEYFVLFFVIYFSFLRFVVFSRYSKIDAPNEAWKLATL